MSQGGSYRIDETSGERVLVEEPTRPAPRRRWGEDAPPAETVAASATDEATLAAPPAGEPDAVESAAATVSAERKPRGRRAGGEE